jgi:hypothetical protein
MAKTKSESNPLLDAADAWSAAKTPSEHTDSNVKTYTVGEGETEPTTDCSDPDCAVCRFSRFRAGAAGVIVGLSQVPDEELADEETTKKLSEPANLARFLTEVKLRMNTLEVMVSLMAGDEETAHQIMDENSDIIDIIDQIRKEKE